MKRSLVLVVFVVAASGIGVACGPPPSPPTTTTSTTIAVPARVVDIGAGDRHMCAVLSDGTAKCVATAG